MIGLYIHIPFCAHICNYCDFAKKIRYNQTQEDKYILKLKEEILKYESKFNEIDTVYIGGGTPNSLSINNLESLLSFINDLHLNLKEFSIELNPELISLEQINLFKKYRVSRVSLGVQSFNDNTLNILGRKHNKEIALNSIKLLKDNGINNINIDLMFGIFNQSFDDLKKDIDTYLSLDLPHLSCYSLILEENTMFNKLYKESEIDEDLTYKMMKYLIETLKLNNYHHYEISNFAKKGYESLHNLKYWNKDYYIGCGMGACSYFKDKRITNSYYINNYLNDKDIFIENLDLKEEKQEFMMLGLRKIDGISIKEYNDRFNSDLFKDFDLNNLLDKNLIKVENDAIKLSDEGIFLANLVFEEFV